MKKTIFINGRFLTQPVTGVQRYSLELLRSIDALLATGDTAQDIRFVCLVPPEPFPHPGWQHIEICRVGINKGNLWEQADLAFHARGELLFSPANIGPFHYRNQVVTIHDASVFAVPNAYSRTFRAKYTFVFKQFAHRVQQILTVSEFSQQELAKYLNIQPERLTVTHNGSDHMNRIEADAQILKQHNIQSKEYLLIVASQSAHKNLANIYQALKFVTPGTKVVAVGGSFNRVFQGKHLLTPPENVQMPGYINDPQLKALYENALGFIFPSTYEGFGLPILEAMRCGCPVLCSNAASMREVAGDAATYFDPYQPQQIAQVFNQFLADRPLREQLIGRGYEQAERFTWSSTAQKTLAVLYKALL